MNPIPILFSRPMVNAILAGHKTQTRRIITPGNSTVLGYEVSARHEIWQKLNFDVAEFRTHSIWGATDRNLSVQAGPPEDASFYRVRPRLTIGVTLWVREEHYQFGHWQEISGVKTKRGRSKWKFVADTEEVRFDAPESYRKGRHHKDPATPAWHKRLARFMPRKFARLTLEVTSLKAERLQAICEEDAKAEGIPVGQRASISSDLKTCTTCGQHKNLHIGSVPCCPRGYGTVFNTLSYKGGYKWLWETLHGPGSWDQNPWVWVIEFKVLTTTQP